MDIKKIIQYKYNTQANVSYYQQAYFFQIENLLILSPFELICILSTF